MLSILVSVFFNIFLNFFLKISSQFHQKNPQEFLEFFLRTTIMPIPDTNESVFTKNWNVYYMISPFVFSSIKWQTLINFHWSGRLEYFFIEILFYFFIPYAIVWPLNPISSSTQTRENTYVDTITVSISFLAGYHVYLLFLSSFSFLFAPLLVGCSFPFLFDPLLTLPNHLSVFRRCAFTLLPPFLFFFRASSLLHFIHWIGAPKLFLQTEKSFILPFPLLSPSPTRARRAPAARAAKRLVLLVFCVLKTNNTNSICNLPPSIPHFPPLQRGIIYHQEMGPWNGQN